MRCTADDGHL